MFIKFILNNDF